MTRVRHAERAAGRVGRRVRCCRCGFVSPTPPDADIECCWKGPDWQPVLLIPKAGDSRLQDLPRRLAVLKAADDWATADAISEAQPYGTGRNVWRKTADRLLADLLSAARARKVAS